MTGGSGGQICRDAAPESINGLLTGFFDHAALKARLLFSLRLSPDLVSLGDGTRQIARMGLAMVNGSPGDRKPILEAVQETTQ